MKLSLTFFVALALISPALAAAPAERAAYPWLEKYDPADSLAARIAPPAGMERAPAAGGNLNPGGLSMFEPMGGSAPKYTGQNVINPLGAIAAVGMLLRETGNHRGDAKLVDAGNRVEQAIIAPTPKMKNQAAGQMGYSTTQVGDLVAEAVRGG